MEDPTQSAESIWGIQLLWFMTALFSSTRKEYTSVIGKSNEKRSLKWKMKEERID